MLEILNQLFLDYGLFGLFVLMFLNMLIFTPPSEIILPLAGFFTYSSGVPLLLVIFVAVFANLLATYIWYFVGKNIGYKSLFKIKYFKKREKSIRIIAEKFKKEESYWVGVFRLFPLIRAIVSIPAGMVKMPHKFFVGYSLIGMTLWTSFWVFSGYFLGLSFFEYGKYVLGILFLVLLFVIFLFHRRMSKYLKKERIVI